MIADLSRVPPTLGLSDAAETRWQVIVVGAGPAGSTCAARLAARGVRTLLVDRHAMPREKVCGGCLSTTALKELRSLDKAIGVGALPGLLITPLTSVRLSHRGRTALLSLPSGGVVSRDALDPMLVRTAIDAGAAWLPQCPVASVDDETEPSAVSLRVGPDRNAVLVAAFVVLATGLSDGVRLPPTPGSAFRRSTAPGSRIGLGLRLPADSSDLPAGRLLMAIGDSGYCGLVRFDDGRLDLAAAVDRTALARHSTPASAILALFDEAGELGRDQLAFTRALRHGVVQATPPLTRAAPLVSGVSSRILRVGDAAGYVEPFTGEGIGWALAGGRLLAEALPSRPRASGDRLPPAAEVAQAYSAGYHQFFDSKRRRCHRVARLLRRPLAVAAAVSLGATIPSLASRFLPAIVGTARMDP